MFNESSLFTFFKVLSDSNLTQCSCLLLLPVIGGTEMCLVLLIYDVTFFSSLQGVLLSPLEKSGLKRVRQYIFIYVHPATRCDSRTYATPWRDRLEAFVLFQLPYVECMCYYLKRKGGFVVPPPLGTQKKHFHRIWDMVYFCNSYRFR